MGPIPARQKSPPYRITMVGWVWHVARSHALDKAVGFVCRDSGGMETAIEIVSGNFYMLNPIGPTR